MLKRQKSKGVCGVEQVWELIKAYEVLNFDHKIYSACISTTSRLIFTN